MHDDTATALIAFLRARMDEDEQFAEATTAAERPWPAEWRKFQRRNDVLVTARPWLVMHADGAPVVGESMFEADAAFIAENDPQRRLADVKSLRHVVNVIENQLKLFDEIQLPIGNMWAVLVLRHLAAPFERHAAYRPEWSPDYGRVPRT